MALALHAPARLQSIPSLPGSHAADLAQLFKAFLVMFRYFLEGMMMKHIENTKIYNIF